VLIFHNKLLTDGAFRNISALCRFLFTSFLITCDGVAVSKPCMELFPPDCVEVKRPPNDVDVKMMNNLQ